MNFIVACDFQAGRTRDFQTRVILKLQIHMIADLDRGQKMAGAEG